MLFRYAPTPSGFLHIGNAVNFVLNYLLAKHLGGQILLRIDDLDTERKRPTYVDDVFRAIEFLGIPYDLGPTGPDDFERHWSQHHRIGLYEETLRELRKTGKLFACQLSRKQLLSYENRYPSECRQQGLSLDDPDVVWRVRVDSEKNTIAGFTDFVVRRRDGLPAYQIASLTDDVYFGITHLVRGEDLRQSTFMQQYLATLLDHKWSAFLSTITWHHPLIMGTDGQKLSKSAGSTSLRSMQEQRQGPELIYRLVGHLLGLPPEASSSLTDLQRLGRFEYLI